MTTRAVKTSDAVLTQTITREVAKRVVGQEVMVERLLIGLLTGGHVLLEGVPGLAKTLAVRTVAECLRIAFSRIQFTPDLLPADVIGTMVFDQKTQEFYPKKGPLFANLVLADEINRAPAKVQAALLEAMQEKQVTIGGETFFLGEPFLVLATQNPIEQEGTYPLPEAQLDRFMLKVRVEYPTRDAEKEIVARMASGRPIEVQRIAEADDILAARSAIAELFMDQKVVDYIVDVVRGTREPQAIGLPELKPLIAFGASPFVPARSLLRGPGGCEGHGVRRAAPPRAPHLRGGGRGHGPRPGDREDPGGGGRAVMYEGRERRRAAPSPVRARRRTVTAEVLRQVKGIELRTRALVNTLFTGDYRSVFRGQGIEFAEVRAYQQGDDFRAIDWNVSARMGHPFVKTFHEEREITLLLVVDQSGSCQFGRPYTKAGLAVEVAAVLALAAARHNDRVGALTFADKVEFVVRPKKGRPHALRVIRDLVAFVPRGQGTNLGEALHYATKLLRHHAIVVVLSDFRAEGWEEPLRRLAADHDVVAITIDDPREVQLPDAGWVDLEDAETGQRVLLDTSHSPTRTRVRVAAERQMQLRTRKLIQAGVDRVALQTNVPYAPLLRRAFAERARRLKR